MDINTVSDTQLQILIFMLGFGALCFAVVFFMSFMAYIRKAKGKQIQTSNNTNIYSTNSSIQNFDFSEGDRAMAKQSESPKKGLLKSTLPKSKSRSSDVSMPLSKQVDPHATTLAQNTDAETAPRELLRVLVDPKTKEIILEVDGQQFRQIRQIKDKQIGQRILEVVALLLQFTGGLIATSSGIKTLAKPKAKLSSLPPVDNNNIDIPNPAITKPAKKEIPQPIAQPESSETLTAPSSPDIEIVTSPPNPMQPAVSQPSPSHRFSDNKKQEQPSEADIPMLNLAAEIDAILQKKLEASNQKLPLKISSGWGGQVEINVAGRIYSGVDEIEDEHIKALIQDAIKTWERS